MDNWIEELPNDLQNNVDEIVWLYRGATAFFEHLLEHAHQECWIMINSMCTKLVPSYGKYLLSRTFQILLVASKQCCLSIASMFDPIIKEKKEAAMMSFWNSKVGSIKQISKAFC